MTKVGFSANRGISHAPRGCVKIERMRISFPLLVGSFAVALAAGGPVAAQTGIVRYVTEGDTFRLTSGERIRKADAP